MTTFRLTSKDGSKSFYDFSTAGMGGTIMIDTSTLAVELVKAGGRNAGNEREKGRLLEMAVKKLSSEKFPERCVHATH